MPAPKPGSLPDWDTTLANLLMPPGGQIASGWTNGEVVPSNWLNWWMNLVGQWEDYLNDFEIQAHTWTVQQTFTGSPQPITATGQSTFTAVGAGQAISASSSGAGNAVNAVNVSTGDAVFGSATSGAGVEGVSQTGPGVKANANATRGAINVVPAAMPSAPSNGDVWSDSTRKTAVARLNGTNWEFAGHMTPVVVGAGGTFLDEDGNTLTVPAYQNGWTAFVGAGGVGLRFWKDGAGVVHLSGAAANAAAGQSVVFPLPAGYRPATFPRSYNGRDISATANNATVTIDNTTGDVTVNCPNNGDAVSLDGITFETF